MRHSLFAFFTSVALVLLAIVDFRRGFLFATYSAKSPYYAFTPWQLVFLAIGLAGAFSFARGLKRSDARLAKATLLGLFLLLLGDAILYRGVAATRAVNAGSIGTDWLNAFGVGGLWKPLALCASYVLTVWHATFLSCLGAGLAPLVLSRLLRGSAMRSSWGGSIGGAVYSLTQPFCSCCVAMTSPGLFRPQHSSNFVTAVLLGSPLLNVSTLILAASLLPWPFAALRILGGVTVTIALSFFVSRWLSRRDFGVREGDWACAIESDVPFTLVADWLKLSGRVALILVPSMILGTILSAAVWSLWPAGLGNSVLSVLVTSLVGSFVMVSTWSEIPLALKMIQEGLPGPAAAALLALPAVNLGSLLIVGKVSRDWKMTAGLGLGTVFCSLMAGLAFL